MLPSQIFLFKQYSALDFYFFKGLDPLPPPPLLRLACKAEMPVCFYYEKMLAGHLKDTDYQVFCILINTGC